MATMAEIERDYPEWLARLRFCQSGRNWQELAVRATAEPSRQPWGTMTFAEFTERLAAGLELYRAALSGRG